MHNLENFRPRMDIKPPELEEFMPKLKLPEAGGAARAQPEPGTEIQEQLAGILKEAFTQQKDSLDAEGLLTQPVKVERTLEELPADVKIDANTNTIHYQGHEFSLPKALTPRVVNGKTTIVYTPRALTVDARGQQAASLAAAPPHPRASKSTGPQKDPVMLKSTVPDKTKPVVHTAPPPPKPAPIKATPAKTAPVSENRGEEEDSEKPAEPLFRPDLVKPGEVSPQSVADIAAHTQATLAQMQKAATDQHGDKIAQAAGSEVAAIAAVSSSQAGQQGQQKDKDQSRHDAEAAATGQKMTDEATSKVSTPGRAETPGKKS